jgi:AAA15 family ATPase/GTPase
MRIRKLAIKNFRGIRNLEWKPDDDGLICLIGHGDSTKSTILKAIEYVLHPKWDLQLSDADFYQCKPSENNIEIEIVIGQISEREFGSDIWFSTLKSFWNIERKEMSDSAEHESCETVIKIILRIDSSLEPIWIAVNEAGEEEVIKHGYRKMFNMVRLDDNSERNFRWGYNSILSKLLEKDNTQEIRTILADAGRKSRTSFDDTIIPPELKKCADIISEEAKLWGTGHSALKPYLDVFSADSLCLNDDDNVPVYMLGKGSKKLMLIAIEKYLISSAESPEDHIILMDEVENGLEPHRLIHVIFTLREMIDQSNSQVILSTHSPVVLVEIAGNGTYRVKNYNGDITVTRLDEINNAEIRKNPVGYFLKKIVICEGKTEMGVLRGCKKKWIEENVAPPEHYGAYFVLGEGSSMSKCAEVFKKIGYDVCIYKDSDRAIEPIEDVHEFTYDGNINIEQSVCKDAPLDLLKAIIAFCLNSSNSRLHAVPQVEPSTEQQRNELAKFLHENEVFRRVDTGEKLCEIVMPFWSEMEDGTFIRTIKNIKNWIYN